MKNSTFSRRGPDYITEELVEALTLNTPLDFKGLFDVIFVKLITRNAAKGGQEMLRLRAYERLQNLVRQGAAKKIDGKYRGVVLVLNKLREEAKAMAAAAAAGPTVAAAPVKAPVAPPPAAAKARPATSKASSTRSVAAVKGAAKIR